MRPRVVRFKNEDKFANHPPREDVVLAPAKASLLKHKTLAARINGLRGMSWAYAVLRISRMNASEASRFFVSRKADQPKNSKVLYIYLRGVRAPIAGPRGNDGLDLVGAVDSYPGGRDATYWLSHPLWQIFSDDPDLVSIAKITKMNEEIPASLATFMFMQNKPTNLKELEAQQQGPMIGRFEDFVFVCAMFRLAYFAGYWPMHYWLVVYLAKQASKVEPIFKYVEEPFIRMLHDFYDRPKATGV
jgi:hypothetical protein